MKQTHLHLGQNTFRVLSATNLLQETKTVREASGIYTIFLRGAHRLLEATGYSGLAPLVIRDFVHLYSGSSFTLGCRLNNHLVGKLARSTFRQTLFAINTYCDQIIRRDLVRCQGALDEETLSNYLTQNALVAFRYCADPANAESALLKSVASPLNISERRHDSYARRLIAMRCAMKGKPVPRCCWGAAQEALV